VEADLHDELAALGGAAGQRPADAQEPLFDEDGLPERVLGAPGTLPVVEDLGHVPADARLELQA
jgi:hypothetical protein